MSAVRANFMSSPLGRICGKLAGGDVTACGEVAMRRDLVVPCTGAQRAGDWFHPAANFAVMHYAARLRRYGRI